MIVNKKENKLQKGGGYNLDIIVLGFIAMLHGLFGLPFVCAATVRSVSHVSALTVVSTNHAPGESAKIERVLEQRVSNLLVHLLIGELCTLIYAARQPGHSIPLTHQWC